MIDLALCTDEESKKNNLGMPKHLRRSDDDMISQPNVSLAAIVFDNTKEYSFLHSAPSLVDAVIRAV